MPSRCRRRARVTPPPWRATTNGDYDGTGDYAMWQLHDGRQPAVEVDGGAGQVGGPGREEETGQVGKLRTAPDPAQRDARPRRQTRVVLGQGHSGRRGPPDPLTALDEPDQDGVDPDPIRGQ